MFERIASAFAAVAGLAAMSIAPAHGQASDRVVTDHANSVLELTMDGIAPGGSVDLVLRQKLQDGWHVYWRNPGDSGLPLELSWELPSGFTTGETIYPAPHRIPVGPFVNYGHEGEPAFITTLTAPADVRPGDEVRIALSASWLICEETCVPEDGAFEIVAPIVDDPRPVPAVIAHARKTRDEAPAPWSGSLAVHAEPDGPALVLRSDDGVQLREPFHFFADAEGLTEPAAPQTAARTSDEAEVLRLEGGVAYKPEALRELTGTLAIGEGAARRDYRIVAARADGAAPAAASATPSSAAASGSSASSSFPPGEASGGSADMGVGGIAALLAFAFVGGAILNAMPCVFPIIFVKAASLVSSAHDTALVRRQGVVYAAGVVATFVALGGALLALRAGGEQLGWGFHLQSPALVAMSAALLFGVGLNLAGVFEVGSSLQNVGGGLAGRRGDAGAFFTGALAVFVAAPCVGPFLSAPLGAAAFLPPVVGLLIFVAIALGLAAPYVAISFSPALARRLPRPGPWMSTFKQAMSFPVFAASAYFIWVLSQQVGGEGLAIALLGLVALAFAAWLVGLGQRAGDERSGRRMSIAAAVIAFVAVAPIFTLAPSPSADGALAAKGGYGELTPVAFDPSAIASARAEGGVFVDFTAAWCVVCQFNKRTILARPAVRDLFRSHDVTLMAADWTRRDPAITTALEAFGANGVPLYVYYPPTGAPQVLPLPLSFRDIESAIENAQARTVAARRP
ncbi:MAG: thiol:disulfide interchange protein [Alphaproteobacteria bacterium]|nr:thiol:disulfide interchange protein [Alphaproteobacteria bacterium]